MVTLRQSVLLLVLAVSTGACASGSDEVEETDGAPADEATVEAEPPSDEGPASAGPEAVPEDPTLEDAAPGPAEPAPAEEEPPVDPDPPPLEGPAAPDFTLDLADGSAFVPGKEQPATFLVFWAEW